MNTNKIGKSGQRRDKVFLRYFKAGEPARHQVTMKGIVCTIERVERRVSLNIVYRVEDTLIKTTETWKSGGRAGF